MGELIGYFIIRFFSIVVRWMPLQTALGLGRFVGLLIYWFDNPHRMQVYSNIKRAFPDANSTEDITQLTKGFFKHHGQHLVEISRLSLMSKANLHQHLAIDGKENLQAAYDLQKGVLIVTSHFGSWELLRLSLATLGYRYTAIIKSAAYSASRLENIFDFYRRSTGSNIVARKIKLRSSIKEVDKGEVVSVLIDQHESGNLVKIFDREIKLSTEAIRIAMRDGIPVCFASIVREKNNQHRVKIHPAFDLQQTGDYDKDMEVNLKLISKEMEHYIGEYPQQYMWMHDIWKYSKKMQIAAIYDDKTGHTHQSKAVTTILKDALTQRGIQAKVNMIKVQYRSSRRYKIFCALGFFSFPFLRQGNYKFLEWFFTKESVEALSSGEASYVVSTGSSLAPINYLLTRENSAKNIAILMPGIMRFKQFTLIVLPEHDKPKHIPEKPLFAFTHAAPNLVNEAFLKKQEAALLDRYSHLKNSLRTKIGIFIGGDSKNVFISEQQIKVVCHQISEVVKEMKVEILITTSRRTPQHVEKILLKYFKKLSSCLLFIQPNKDDVPEAMGGILALSDILVVSGDSISMVSEAASSGKKTIVFTPEVRGEGLRTKNKHKLFIENLSDQGFIVSTDVHHIGQSIYNVAKNKIQTRSLTDRQILFDALKEII